MRLNPLTIVAIAGILLTACSGSVDNSSPLTVRIAADVDNEFRGEQALASVAILDNYIRWPGNRDFDASIAHIVERLEAAGFVPEVDASAASRLVYRIEEFPLDQPAWRPVNATLRIDGQDTPLMSFSTNRNMLALHSFSTPNGEVVVDVIDVGDGSDEALDAVDVRGKAVFGDRDITELFEDAVIARGAAGVLAYSMPSYTNPQSNDKAVQFGEIAYDDARRSWGITLSYSAKERLRNALNDGDVRVRVTTQVEWTPDALEKTAVAELRGSLRPQERFVFSAHVQEPGANDNASGVAAQLEMARVAARLLESGAVNPQRTITFLWGDEMASTRRFVNQCTARKQGILWGLSMDMVGQDMEKTGASFLIEKIPDPSAIWTRGTESFSEWGAGEFTRDMLMPHYLNDVVLGRALERAASNGWIVKTNPFEGGSDHQSFLESGIPAVLLWHFTDQYYHTDLDRLEMVSAPEMKNVGVTALTTALTLTSADARTARQLIDEVRQAAINRLEIETALSLAAMRDGGSVEAEYEILETWARWYDGALLATDDIEVGGSSASVQRDIAAAREEVREALKTSRERLVGHGGGTGVDEEHSTRDSDPARLPATKK